MGVAGLFDLTRRVAIVTGGSAGLGCQMAEGLAEMGANLVICSRKKEGCESAASRIKQQFGVEVLPLPCDVRRAEDIEQAVNDTVSRFGRIDVLINNAGATWGAPVEAMRLEHWNKVIETNLTGTFLFSQAVGKVMIQQHAGNIINIASIAGMRGASPDYQAIAYHASKGGVITFTKDLACKWAMHNIRVNAIAPGWFITRMTAAVLGRDQDSILRKIPLGRLGNEQDLKAAVVFLASPASDYVTGHVLVVDGGMTAM